MKPVEVPIFAGQPAAPLDASAWVPWTSQLVAGASATGIIEQTFTADDVELFQRSTPSVSLISATIPNATALAAGDFEQAVVRAYHQIHRALSPLTAAEPVRFWNHLPAIHQTMDEQRDRYMVFNAGRFRALADWFGGADQLAGRVATASGVGHQGADFIVHCLALVDRGRSIENPQQIPAFRYSRKYGPRPPCFARATLVRLGETSASILLVGGTASICGEQSVYLDQLLGQFRQTLSNLASLVRAADPTVAEADALQTFESVRIYFPTLSDAPAIEQHAAAAFTNARQIELIQADLCRADLLVEIEGVATL